MRVLFVAEKSYPHSLSGISNWAHDLIDGLPRHRFIVLAVTSPHCQPIIYKRPQNLEGLINVPLAKERDEVREATPSEKERFDDAINQVLAFLQRDLPSFASGLLDLVLLGDEVNLWPLFEERHLWGRVQGLLRPKLPYTPSLAEIALCVNWLRKSLTPLLFIPPKADLVHTTVNALGALPTWIASQIHNAPLLLTEHHVALRERYLISGQRRDLLSFKRFQTSFCEALSRLIYWQADRILSVSEFNRTWQLRFAAPRERTRVIPNGIDLDRFPELTQQVQTVPTLVWVGRLDPLKNIETLLEAFWQVRQLVHEARLILVGPVTQPRYFAKLQTVVTQLGLETSVSFERVQPSHKAFAIADVVVSASKSEGLPLTLLEAMAAGKAVVATRVGGVNELLGDAGRLVPAQSPATLATALIDLLQHPDEWLRLGRKARERAKLFTLEKMLASYGQLYEDLVTPLRPREAPVFITTERPSQNDFTIIRGDARRGDSAGSDFGGGNSA